MAPKPTIAKVASPNGDVVEGVEGVAGMVRNQNFREQAAPILGLKWFYMTHNMLIKCVQIQCSVDECARQI